MPKITYKDYQGTSKTIEVESGLSVMEGAIQKEIPGIDADCGGSMACATCHVYVDDKWFDKIPKAQDAEIDMIDMAFEPKKNSRLIWRFQNLIKEKENVKLKKCLLL